MSELKWKSDHELVEIIQKNQAYITEMESDKMQLMSKINHIDVAIHNVSQRSEWAMKYLSRAEQPAYLQTRHDPMRSE